METLLVAPPQPPKTLGSLVNLLLDHASDLKAASAAGGLQSDGVWLLSVAWVRKYAQQIITKVTERAQAAR